MESNSNTNPNDFFWTDAQQAVERIQGTCILYDGLPVYVTRVEPHEDGIPRAKMSYCTNGDKSERKMLNSPKFKRFRVLPSLGWMNSDNIQQGAMYLCRVNVNSRQHGLSRNNVRVHHFHRRPDSVVLTSGEYSFDSLMFDKGFTDAHVGKYPSLEATLANIEDNSAIAFSLKYCVSRDTDGLRWLYRGIDKVGIFTGADTLNLLSKFSYLREEIMADPAMTINNIREF